MCHRVDPDTNVLWVFRKGAYLPCVPENRILPVLRLVHDQEGHWGKQGTLAQLRGFVYWPTQSTDLENYIRGCLQCACHGPATNSQLLNPVRVQRLFQLLGMDFIRPLPLSTRGFRFILRYWLLVPILITLPTKTANVPDVALALQRVFTLYATLLPCIMTRDSMSATRKYRFSSEGMAWLLIAAR